jgi:hypothetical protein
MQLSASANSGWQFEAWGGLGQGSYAGAGNASVTFLAPIVEKATFYPGLTISAGGGGAVSYTYPTASSTGTVSAGSTSIVYLPLGTQVSVVANPSSSLSAFSGWTGAVSGTSSQITVVLDSPKAINAGFSSNLVIIGAIIGGFVVIVAVASVLILRRRRV